MAATVSSVWAKPGAWALDSELHEEELKQELLKPVAQTPATDFPSLAAAVKPGKKKSKPVSLADFHKAPATHDDLPVNLPTAPRERTEEELQQARSRGFRNFSENRDSTRARPQREERDLGPSRADEVDDWSKTKRVPSSFDGGRDREMGPSRADEVNNWSEGKRVGGGGERRERVGFFNSSRADEVDNWGATKSFAPAENRRDRRVGFDATGALDSDNWGKNKVVKDSGNGGGRPRLNLQPRTLPVEQDVVKTDESEKKDMVAERKPKENPFGAARPREEVLKEKGQDWKDIDDKLEAVKIKEVQKAATEGFGGGRRRDFGLGSGEENAVRTWRKPNVHPALSAADSPDANPAPPAPVPALSLSNAPAPYTPIFGSFALMVQKSAEVTDNAKSAENVREEN